MNSSHLGSRVQAARLSAGLTQQELCEQAGLSYSTLAKIERGAIKAPSIFIINQICQALGLTIEGLLSTGVTTVKQRARSSTKEVLAATPVSFVYCDINGVMVRFYQRAFAALAHTTNQPLDLVETIFWRYNDAVCKGEMSEMELNRVLAESLEAQVVDWRSLYVHAVEPITEMHDYVKSLVGRYKVGLISNIFPGFLQALKDAGKLPDISYDAEVDSSVVHEIKPHKHIYEIAEKRANANASQILLIDDTRANIIAAQEQGWRAIWFDSYHPAESVGDIEKILRA